MLPSSSLLPLFWSMSGYGLHGVSPISRRPPSEANPPTSDWIVWRVIEPDSYYTKEKISFQLVLGLEGSQTECTCQNCSRCINHYLNFPCENGARERGREKWDRWAVQSHITELKPGSKAGFALPSMQREQSPMPRGMTETNAHWLQEGASCFPGFC